MTSRLLAPTVAALLVVSTVVAAVAPANPVLAERERLEWSSIRTPSDDDYVVVAPSEVSVLTMGSSYLWYASDIPNERFLWTEDGGLTWQDDIREALLNAEPAPELPVWDIAVAPDDPDFLVAVTSFDHGGGVVPRSQVYVSDDRGVTWECAYVPEAVTSGAGLQISDIDIAPLSSGERDVAICTRNPVDLSVAGDVWVAQSTAWTSWVAQDVNAGAGMDVSSVRFSPDYAADETIICVASDADDTYLWTGYRDRDANSTLWNVTDPDYFEICETDEDSPGEDELMYCELVVPPEYSGDIAANRNVYLYYTSDTEYDDAYWIEDNEVKRLDVDRGSDVELASLAYFKGLVMVGEIYGDAETGRARVWICRNPQDSFPSWYEPEKHPSGGYNPDGIANARVAITPDGNYGVCWTSTSDVMVAADWASPAKWAGNVVGDPDESAVSRCDTGYNFLYWNQISLIDTDMEHLCDYSLWIVGDLDEDDPGNVVYLASQGVGLDSIWRTRAALMDDLGQYWERVHFTVESGHDDIIMRRTPGDTPEDAVFCAIRDTNYAYKSLDEGRSWERIRECPDITDFAVVDSERLYVLDGDLLNIAQWTKVRRWYVWEWERDIETGLEPNSGYSLAYHGNNYIMVGDDGQKAEIAVSTDGGETFELLPALPELGKVHIVLDEDFARNKLMYAATEAGASSIYRWVIGGATEWDSLHTPDSGFTGLTQIADALYGAYGEGVDRTLVPRAESVTAMEWDNLTVGLNPGTDYFRSGTLRSLLLADVELWGVDGREYDYDAEEGCLWVYSDTFVLPTPWPTSPATGEVLPCDSCACDACPFCFHWKGLPKACEYELWVAMDERFDYVLLEVDGIDVENCGPPGVCYFEIPFNFDCGQTYFWRVRATATEDGEEVHTRWSPPMRFQVAAGTTVETMHVFPQVDSPEPGAQGISRTPGLSWTGFPPTTVYELYLSDDNGFNNVIAREELDRSAYVYPGQLEWGKTYFWKVRALEPVTSEWMTASFTVIPEPAPEPELGSSPLEQLPLGFLPEGTPTWIWLVIGSLVLLNVLIVLAVMLGRAGARRSGD